MPLTLWNFVQSYKQAGISKEFFFFFFFAKNIPG